MRFARSLAVLFCAASHIPAATFGTVVAAGASYSDIVLDEPRARLYLVNTNIGRIDVYGLKTRTFQNPITTDSQPLAAAISPDGRYLYVTSNATSNLDIIDLNANQLSSRVSIASPEGVAVGGDGRALISTASTTNPLWIYDPTQTAAGQTPLTAVPVAPPAAVSPAVANPPGRIFTSNRSALMTTRDGKLIIGANGVAATTAAFPRVVFVYEVASGTVLRSRSVANLSEVLSVAPDGSRFMSGSTLFDTQTLQVMAQENAANAPFAFPTGTNFNTITNQGGSIFAPDGSVIYAAFNIAPSGSTSTHTVELLVNDPDNLSINLGLQVPENLVGKMVIDAAGANVYALSDSGFTILPISTIANSPLASPSAQSILLTSDQCLVYAAQNTAADVMNNLGKGRFTAAIQTYTATTANTGLGGIGGPGGGIVITLPGFGGIVTAPGITTAPANSGAGPMASVTNTSTGATLNFRYNPAATTNPGTTGPSDFLVTSPEAINIPGNVHVFQNNRSSESQGTIVPVSLNASSGEGLTDLLLDNTRQKIYITNSGMNRIEVFDLTQQKFVSPIKVGQLPHGMALGPDGSTLYVANTGGESISIVNLAKSLQTGRVAFPALPLNAAFPLSTPQTIAGSARGPQFVMSDGSVWKVDGGQAIPRTLNPAIFSTRTVSGGNPAFWSMSATPNGEYVLLMTGTGNAYLYDDTVDDFTLTRQVLTAPLTGYLGPVTAGPQGRYYSVGGTLLNASLTPIAGGTNGTTAAGRTVAAVTAVSANVIAEFTQPVRATATAAVTDAGEIELYNATTGAPMTTAPTLEGAPSTVTGNSRVSTFARTMAIDASGAAAYALTASGLSIIPLNTNSATSLQNRPAISNGGIVSLADYTSSIATGGLVTIFGRNLGTPAVSSASPLPTTLGGTCVTLNNQPLPLTFVNAGQINGEIPTTLAAGRYSLVIHSITNSVASSASTLTVAKYAPAILIGDGKQAAILHSDGSFVTPDNRAQRDENLMIFAIGLGPTKGGTVTTGRESPASPLATVCADQDTCDKAVEVFFGPPGDTRSPVVVDWAGLTPGLVGVYQINVYVPGIHLSGDAVPVTIKVANVSSSVTGPVPPTVALD